MRITTLWSGAAVILTLGLALAGSGLAQQPAKDSRPTAG